MKATNSIILIALVFFIISCSERKQQTDGKQAIGVGKLKSYETKGLDTINRIDVFGNKQGKWMIYKDTLLIEQGIYNDGKKQGVWIFFGIDGRVKKQINYINDRPVPEKDSK